MGNMKIIYFPNTSSTTNLLLHIQKNHLPLQYFFHHQSTLSPYYLLDPQKEEAITKQKHPQTDTTHMNNGQATHLLYLAK
jgi:hypothetical protein